ncbi:MAG TPA: hypothetical protein VMR28_03680 [Candidatus Saccharimonadales bacterium]|nr:hypothetical protein [Candidatus Saccharimonadales bacterium]
MSENSPAVEISDEDVENIFKTGEPETRVAVAWTSIMDFSYGATNPNDEASLFPGRLDLKTRFGKSKFQLGYNRKWITGSISEHELKLVHRDSSNNLIEAFSFMPALDGDTSITHVPAIGDEQLDSLPAASDGRLDPLQATERLADILEFIHSELQLGNITIKS